MAAVRPSFFKPLMKNFSTVLWLPPGFVRKHRHLLPEKAKLRTRSGKIWTVKIEKPDEDDECFFTEGWSDFVKDLGLQRIQMLVFWLNVDDGTFDVSVYDPDSNEREFSAGGSSSVIMVESDSEEDESDETPPRFRFALTKSRRSRVVLQKRFATEAGLIGKTSVILQYLGRKRYWKVALLLQSSMLLGVGWHGFRVGNKLEYGRIYSFEFDFVKNLILVSDCSSTSESRNLHATIKNCEDSSIDPIWRYIKELKKHNFTFLSLGMPNTFVTGVGIATEDTLNLEDSRGMKKWPVTIKYRGKGVFTMTRGVKDFLRENHLQVGDILLFESVPNSVDNAVKFVVMEKEAGKEMIVRSGMGGIIMP